MSKLFGCSTGALCVDTCAGAADAWKHAASDAHVPLVDVTAALCKRFHETGQPLNGFWNTIPGVGHLNAEGHEVVAAELAAALRGATADR
jgi:hypothetical protein